jgi:hypothetical protein
MYGTGVLITDLLREANTGLISLAHLLESDSFLLLVAGRAHELEMGTGSRKVGAYGPATLTIATSTLFMTLAVSKTARRRPRRRADGSSMVQQCP